MKKILSLLLTIVLIGTVVAAPVSAQSIGSSHLQTEEIADQVVPVAYTSDFAQQSNIVCVLNSDGTKTAYVFASAEDAAQVDSITGLTSPETMIRSNEGTNIAPENFEDATVYSGSPNTNYGDSAKLALGETLDNGYARTYIKLKDSTIDSLRNVFSYKNLLGASLCLNKANDNGNLSGIYEIYMLKSNWSENAITWNNRPDYYNDVLTMSNGFITAYELQDFYITKTLMGWMQGMPNYGLMLKEKDDQHLREFNSTECGSTAFTLRPYLSITFLDEETPMGQGINTSSQSYYIVNRQNGLCLTAMSGSYGSMVYLRTGDANYTNQQVWHFGSAGGGTYKIQLGKTGVYLCNSASGTLTMGYFIGLPQDVWTIDRNWNGTYTLKNNNSSSRYLSSNSAGTHIMGNYVCDMSFYDEWSLVPATIGTAALLSMENVEGDGDITTSYGMDVIKTQLEQRNYHYVDNLVNYPASRGFIELTSSDFFYFNQHGFPGELHFYEGASNGEGIFSKIVSSGIGDYSLSNLSPNALNRLRLAFISSCETGANVNLDGASNGRANDNMAGRMYWLGAHNVVSFFHRVGANSRWLGTGTVWNNVFITNSLLGRSLKNAKGRADRYIFHDIFPEDNRIIGANERHDLGDDSFSICSNMALQSQTMQYRYSAMPHLSFSPTNSSSTSLIMNLTTGVPASKKFTLPISKINNIDEETWKAFDVYTDNIGGIYWYYAGTNTLHSYEPYTDNISLGLGESIVDGETALSVANTFLTQNGYDYSGYTLSTSNIYSKNYTVQYIKGNQKLVFHMQADSVGNVYILDFIAHGYSES